MFPSFFFNEGTFDYDFGPQHPLRPERLHRMFALLDEFSRLRATTTAPATDQDLVRVHTADYVRAVSEIDKYLVTGAGDVSNQIGRHRFWGDNPPFAGVDAAARAYTGATVAAAKEVRDGADLAFGIGGGLHHAMADYASGFCIYNDVAIACSILRDRFDRVAYVDVDVHHGDGVQWIFYEDPTVLTCSIHEDPRTLWPGTGGIEETGAEFSALNVPMQARTTDDVWLDSFRKTILVALQRFEPQAIVLQIGADTHYLDPLAHILNTQQGWLSAITDVRSLGIPMVVAGGGGYNLTTVPRMWTSAILTLCGIEYSDEIPEPLATQVGSTRFTDAENPYGSNGGEGFAKRVVDSLVANHTLLG